MSVCVCVCVKESVNMNVCRYVCVCIRFYNTRQNRIHKQKKIRKYKMERSGDISFFFLLIEASNTRMTADNKVSDRKPHLCQAAIKKDGCASDRQKVQVAANVRCDEQVDHLTTGMTHFWTVCVSE